MTEEALAFPRGLCSGHTCRDPTTARCSPSMGASPLPGWQLGTASGSVQEQLSRSRVPAEQPFRAGCSWCHLCPSPGHGRRQDPALLLPGLLAERQEFIMLPVRPAPHLIAPLARRKINSTFYTLAASVLKFWHICELKKKVIKPGKCHLIVLAELIWRLRCSGVISPSIQRQGQAPGSTLLTRLGSHRCPHLGRQLPVATVTHCHRLHHSWSQTSPFTWRIPG